GMETIVDSSATYANNIIDDHNEALIAKEPSINNAYDDVFSGIKSNFDSFSEDMLAKANDYIDSLESTLTSFDPINSPIVSTSWGTKVGSIRTPAYATGGMPEDGL